MRLVAWVGRMRLVAGVGRAWLVAGVGRGAVPARRRCRRVRRSSWVGGGRLRRTRRRRRSPAGRARRPRRVRRGDRPGQGGSPRSCVGSPAVPSPIRRRRRCAGPFCGDGCRASGSTRGRARRPRRVRRGDRPGQGSSPRSCSRCTPVPSPIRRRLRWSGASCGDGCRVGGSTRDRDRSQAGTPAVGSRRCRCSTCPRGLGQRWLHACFVARTSRSFSSRVCRRLTGSSAQSGLLPTRTT